MNPQLERKNMRTLSLLLTLILLTGCAGDLARWMAYGQELEMKARAYVDERHRIRQAIRQRCEEGLWREVDSLEADGRFKDARRLLDENYPSLLTVEFVTASREGDLSAVDRPWGCQTEVLPTLNGDGPAGGDFVSTRKHISILRSSIGSSSSRRQS